MYVNPGELDKQIEIYLISANEQDDEGHGVVKKTLVRRCHAKVSYTSGSELVQSGSDFSATKQRFLVRWTETEINTDMTILYAGKEYGIVYVNPYGDSREYMEIWTSMAERE